jgi:hypothetical protein
MSAGFLARWSQRKVQERQGVAPPEPMPEEVPSAVAVPPVPVDVSAEPPIPTAPTASVEPAPTLDDVARLPDGAEVARFVARGVDPAVKNAALKKLFADPHFNVMDGLDTYIDDYGRPDPLPAAMLRQMAQSKFLGLFDEPAEPAAPTASATDIAADEDPDLRLQPHDAAGRGCDRPDPGADAGSACRRPGDDAQPAVPT